MNAKQMVEAREREEREERREQKAMNATMQKAATVDELARILGCKPPFVAARMKALGLTVACNRCGGSGHYSYCPTHGTICFGCDGSGQVVPKPTPALVEKARTAVAEGKLQPYLDRMARRSAAKKAANQAWAAMTASRVAPAYSAASMKPVLKDGRWLYLQTTNPRLFATMVAMNDLCSEADTLARLMGDGRWDAKVRGYVRIDDTEVDRVAARLIAIPGEIEALDYDPTA